MSKFILFYILYWLTGNPLLALLVIVAIILAVDRTYLSFIPDPFKALRSSSRTGELQKVISINPHDGRSLKELGILLVEKGDFKNAAECFRRTAGKMADDPEFNYYYGIAEARSGDISKGRELVEKALLDSPRLKYGEPYLMMAEVYLDCHDYRNALPLLEKFVGIHSSSSRGFYRLGVVKMKLGMKDEGIEYLRKSIRVFKSSPLFKRRVERKWALKARILIAREA
ncbi:MAG: tetratricopeptide repeat protein [Candidatus Sulfobium sp.]|jgi:tetratricopeptide (TPR) repeat protein